MNYSNLSVEELQTAYQNVKKRYLSYQRERFSLDLSRGKLCPDQLALSMPMLTSIASTIDFSNKVDDYRNYGLLEGVPELRKIFAEIFDVSPDDVFLGGCSSLNLMYDVFTKAWCFGVGGGSPWCRLPKVKFLCPVPGYDRHFAILEEFGVEMIAIPTDDNGPLMDVVEELVANDISIKGIFCVPRFSNPSGIVYSDEVVTRLATMKTAAADFRIFWDNSYAVHEIYADAPKLLNIFKVPGAVPDRVYLFGSTSKITFSSGGTCCLITDKTNFQQLKKHFSVQTINFDKVNQYEHALFLKDLQGVKALMEAHANILRPKFDVVFSIFDEGFKDNSYVKWTKPKGGYFLTLTVMEGTAKRVIELCRKIGLTLTPAGAPFPLHQDDLDSTIRIAPTYANENDLETACRILVTCVDYAIMEKLCDNE